ncbi:MAG: anthranilate synthase component I family protein [Actinobacteria bacterium]|nr:anthranilate synthase component I family protein [Actinomycetota bacterium]
MTTTVLDTDLLTPLAAYLRIRAGATGSFLLESVEQGRLGRHSFVGRGARLVSFTEAEGIDAPVVGYLGYDHIATLEPTVPLPAAGPDVPESCFVVADIFLRFDHLSGTAEVLHGDPEEVARLLAEPPAPLAPASAAGGPTVRYPDQAAHERRVERVQEHIRRGDAFQIVLSQRAERPTHATPLAVYRALRRINPSPYLFLLELGDLALVGSSPETHVKVADARASLNPIAGTTARGDGDAERLLASEKDRAEHVMLVDLGRNDLSRVCRPGSVQVERFLEPERFSHVTHLVSEVAGDLQDGVTPFDVLRATFPAGTVSGAPKVRAMQIISELEGYRRGTYGGVVGYHAPGHAGQRGTLDTCIAIRTVLLRDGRAYLQAGGGIVADSVPADEHQECLNKLAALEAALVSAETPSASWGVADAGHGGEP